MKIKDRLAIYFTLVSTAALLGLLVSVYFIFIKFLENDFYDRLNERAYIIAKLYLEADEISADSLQKVKSEYLEKINGEDIRIYDANNKPSFIETHTQFWSNEVINKVRKAKKLRFKKGLHQTVGIFYKDNQGDFVIVASAVDQSSLNRIAKLKTIMIVTFFAITLGLLSCSRWIAAKILFPLDTFIADVKNINPQNLNFRANEGKNNDEINLLAKNFNHLMSHLEQAFILQKTFVANASHELRTPITSLLIGAEITLSQNRSTEEYKLALHSIIEDAEKMNATINSLLNLAQADLDLGATPSTPIRVDELLWDLKDYWATKNGTAQLFIEFKRLPDNTNHLTVNANKTLLEIAINNIIANAFKFSKQQDVYVVLTAASSCIKIEIKDSGCGIADEDKPNIFKPFYTSGKQTVLGGNGMGLYMAQKIINMANGQISFTSDNAGTTVCLTFLRKQL